MHDAQCAGQPIVLQVKVKRLELRGGQHALVDERLAGKAWEVNGFAARPVLARAFGAQFVLGALADHVAAALQRHVRRPGQEHLPEGGHCVAGQRAQRRVVGGYISPAQDLQSFGFGDLLHRGAGGGGVLGRLRQERDAGGVAARGGQLEIDDLAQECVRDLNKDAGAVTAARLGSLGSAMFKVEQRGDGLIDNVSGASAVHIDDHGHSARIVLECGVVQPDTLGRHSHLTLHQNFCAAFLVAPTVPHPEVAG